MWCFMIHNNISVGWFVNPPFLYSLVFPWLVVAQEPNPKYSSLPNNYHVGGRSSIPGCWRLVRWGAKRSNFSLSCRFTPPFEAPEFVIGARGYQVLIIMFYINVVAMRWFTTASRFRLVLTKKLIRWCFVP